MKKRLTRHAPNRPAPYGRPIVWSLLFLLSWPCAVFCPAGVVRADTPFRRGDANADGSVDLSDAIFTLGYLLKDGEAPSCPDAADGNDDGEIDVSDALTVLFHLADGRPLPMPSPRCGADPTPDHLGPCGYDPGLCDSNAPSITDVSILSGAILPVPREGERFFLVVAFDYEDPDGDLAELERTLVRPDGTSVGYLSGFRPPETNGIMANRYAVDSSYPPGSYTISYVLRDEQGNESHAASIEFLVDEGAERPLDIARVAPASERPGKTVHIGGHGFLSPDDDPSDVRVYFGGMVEGDVVAGTFSELSVIVPQRALSGPIAVENGDGRVVSISRFTVEDTIRISPSLSSLVTGQAVDFACTVSGSSSGGIEWTLNGETDPSPALGSLEVSSAGCTYTAPDDPLPGRAVILGCALAGNPAISASLEIKIVPPALPSGEARMVVSRGGVLRSSNDRARISIPPGALRSDRTISIEPVDTDSLSLAAPDDHVLAAVRLSPPGLTFSTPVTVTFSLGSWQFPGSTLALEIDDPGSGGLVDTGRRLTVDEGGLSATGDVSHFSVYAAVKSNVPTYRRTVETRFCDNYSGIFDTFIMEPAPEMSYLEGLSVPVLVTPSGGVSEEEMGPFHEGVRATIVLHDGESTEVDVPFAEPSADGWQLGAVLPLPVLRECHGPTTDNPAGERLEASLRIDYGGECDLSIPLSIECLCELDFSAEEPLPDPLPLGVHRLTGSPGHIRLFLEREHQFSEIRVGPGGILSPFLELPQSTILENPLSIEVTGNVEIRGAFNSLGLWGRGGGEGKDSSEGGLGGEGVLFHSGRGGRGGPYSSPELPKQCVLPGICRRWTARGEDGADATFGGAGGWGGDTWDKPSELGVFFAVLSLASDFFTGNIPGAFEDAYDLADQAVRWDNSDSALAASSGSGGRGPRPYSEQELELASFHPARGGGGGGGSGKAFVECRVLFIDFCGDYAGGGGGGGGGGAPGVKLVVGGTLTVHEGGIINGRGGNGGRGGDGNEKEAAPGGGGGGGNGAQILIVAREVKNNGRIIAQGGFGGLGGEIEEDDEIALVAKGTGWSGRDGILRIDAEWSLENDPLRFESVYRGPRLGGVAVVASESPSYRDRVFLGDFHQVDGSLINYRDQRAGYYYYRLIENGVRRPNLQTFRKQMPFRDGARANVTWELEPGLNALDLEVNREFSAMASPEEGSFVKLHPWQRRYVFWFPGTTDRDEDGLKDRIEQIYGTDMLSADTDGDGVSDWEEVMHHQSDQTIPFLRPDLSVASISFDPPSPRPGKTVTIRAVIKNSRTVSSPSCRGKLRVRGGLVRIDKTFVIPELPIDGTWEYEHQFSPAASGNYTITVTADSGGAVDELKEDNNEMSIDMPVTF